MDERQEKDPIPQRILPQSELDLALMTTDPLWGQRLKETEKVPGVEDKKRWDLWEKLDFYTRDIRLSNLDPGEGRDVSYFLRLAGDYLHAGMIAPAQTCINIVASITEPSQAKRGMLRKRMNTFTKENLSQELEPPKKKLFGGNQQGGY